jgi:hypothetical protein
MKARYYKMSPARRGFPTLEDIPPGVCVFGSLLPGSVATSADAPRSRLLVFAISALVLVSVGRAVSDGVGLSNPNTSISNRLSSVFPSILHPLFIFTIYFNLTPRVDLCQVF